MFDRDMLNDLAKIKVNRKRKVDNIETQIINENKLKAIESDFFDTNEEDFEEIVYESEEDFEKSQALKSLLDDSEKNEKPKSNLENLANFMSGFSGNKSNQNQQQEEEAYEEDDYEDYDDEEELAEVNELGQLEGINHLSLSRSRSRRDVIEQLNYFFILLWLN